MPRTSSNRVQANFGDILGQQEYWAFGDSLTLSGKYRILPSQHWPSLLAERLNASTGDLIVRNWGEGGGTTASSRGSGSNIVPSRIAQFGFGPHRRIPWLISIGYGINDPGAAISQATTQLNLEALIMASKHGATGIVAAETSLPSDQAPGARYVVLTDGSSTGGCSAPSHSGLTPRITGIQTGPTVWECRFAGAGVNSWGRVAIATTAPLWCQRIIVVGTTYHNYPSDAGDNVAWSGGSLSAFRYTEGTSSVSGSAAVTFATYSGVRAAQAAAVNAQDNGESAGKVVFANLYEYVSRRISEGLDAQGSGLNHFGGPATNNIHWSSLGHGVAADCVLQAVKTAGW